MALSKGQKIGIIAGVAGLAALGLAGAANAADPVEPDDGGDDGGDDDGPPQCGAGMVPQLQPDGSFLCVPIVVVDPVEPPPPPPPKNVCNYSGCGPQFDNNHSSPTFYLARIQQLGYSGIDLTLLIISAHNMTAIREFQRDANEVRAADLYDPITNASELDDDGLVGNKTIAMINMAHKAVQVLGLTWAQIVDTAVDANG